jgi:hypothetical protein
VITRLEKEPKLATAVRNILEDPSTRLDADSFQRLRRAGLVVQKTDGLYRIRYRLYEQYLRRQWRIPSQS